jgi:solute carrier family 25 carnitine/acylcarnitine transporter 20/29
MSEAVAKDLAAGTMAGVAQLLVGHPFDTIKVKLQSQPIPPPGQPPKFAGAMDAVRKTLEAEGPKGLYKGMGAPLATVAVFNAVLFTARGQMETLLRDAPGSPLSVSQQMVAGAGAGIAVSFVACPTELVKCRLQAQSALAVAAVTEGAAAPATLAGVGVAGGTTSAATFKAAAIPAAIQYNGPLDVARHVLRSEGGMLGLFKGLTPTLLREVPGNAAMFGAYEATKQYIAGGTYYPNLHPNSSSFFLSPAKNWDSFQQKKASGSDASLLLHSNKEITSNNLVEP